MTGPQYVAAKKVHALRDHALVFFCRRVVGCGRRRYFSHCLAVSLETRIRELRRSWSSHSVSSCCQARHAVVNCLWSYAGVDHTCHLTNRWSQLRKHYAPASASRMCPACRLPHGGRISRAGWPIERRPVPGNYCRLFADVSLLPASCAFMSRPSTWRNKVTKGLLFP
jgi:hypothetical protein